jgi:hypothetical protein
MSAIIFVIFGITVPKFQHATHAKLMTFDCAQCHALDKKSFQPLPPGAKGHRPCSNGECHGPRLSRATGGANLCLECHEKASPSGASAPRLMVREAEARDFGARINHRRHLDVPGLDNCDTCHQLAKQVEGDEVKVLVHRPGHADCAPCHGKQASSPSLTKCASCHLESERQRPKPHAGEAAPWRVYEKFSHDSHRLDVRTAKVLVGGVGRGWSRYDKKSAATLGCGACHTTAAQARGLDDMDLLGACAMEKTCMGQCHNGKWAFQGSGTDLRDCLLCHTDVDEKTPAPPSHCGK